MAENPPIDYGTLNGYFRQQFMQEDGQPLLTLGDITGSSGDRITYGPVFAEVIGRIALDTDPDADQRRIDREVSKVKGDLQDFHVIRRQQPEKFRSMNAKLKNDRENETNTTPFLHAAQETHRVLAEQDHDATVISEDILAVKAHRFQRLRKHIAEKQQSETPSGIGEIALRRSA